MAYKKIYIYYEVPKGRGRKKISRNTGQKMCTFGENYKPTDLRSSTSPKHKK